MHNAIKTAVLLFGVTASAACAADAQGPTVEQLEGLIGRRVSRLVPVLGVPDSLGVFRTGRNYNDPAYVTLFYGSFKVLVDSDTALCVTFTDKWKTAVEGVKFGDSIDGVVKQLGNDYQPRTNNPNQYEWNLSSFQGSLDVTFDMTTRKVTGIELWAR